MIFTDKNDSEITIGSHFTLNEDLSHSNEGDGGEVLEIDELDAELPIGVKLDGLSGILWVAPHQVVID